MSWEQIQKRWSGPQLLVAGLGLLLAVIMFADVMAAIYGDGYLSASSGFFRYVGRWVLLFTIRQISPGSIQVEALFILWASLWLIMPILYLWQPVRLRFLMILFALLSIWYFPIGAWFGVIIIILLAWTKVQPKTT